MDLQLNILAEQEVTKLVAMVAEIQQHLGIEVHDPVVKQMRQPVPIEDVADAVDAAERRAGEQVEEQREAAGSR
jgi:hypothetical protein